MIDGPSNRGTNPGQAAVWLPAGIGLRAPHLAEIMAAPQTAGWFEVHAENYMGHGPAFRALERLRRETQIALHGVGLSLGSADGIDERHLARIENLVARLEPMLVSEHLSWSSIDGIYLNDLLPLPYTEESLDVVSRHIDRLQERLRRQILIENPSSYLRYRHSTIDEAAFLAALAGRTGCGLLCDLNNIYVSACNLGFEATAYLEGLPAAAIGEFHLAGHQVNPVGAQTILIDDHGSHVAEPVWALYAEALIRFGPRPTLVEWDCRLPVLSVLAAEAARADAIRDLRVVEDRDVEAA